MPLTPVCTWTLTVLGTADRRGRGAAKRRGGRGGGGRGHHVSLSDLEATANPWRNVNSAEDNRVPPYAIIEATRPNSINTYASKPFPERCNARILPHNETRIKNSNGALSGPCFQLPLRTREQRQPVRGLCPCGARSGPAAHR